MMRTSPNRDFMARVRSAVAALFTELRRLNNARMDSAAFAALSRRSRARIVKAALAAHHRSPNRCC
jgi:hypothetical protein